MARGRSAVYFEVQGLQDFVKDLGVLPTRWRAAEKLYETVMARTMSVWAKDLAQKYVPLNGVYRLVTRDIRNVGRNTVTYGGAPYDFGAEFGAKRYRQFLEWRGNDMNAGYFFWPAMRMAMNTELDQYLRLAWEQVHDAFPE